MQLRCPRHPKYKGNKTPPNECVACMQIYLQKKGVRKPTAKASIRFKSLKDYTRKPKHKKDWT